MYATINIAVTDSSGISINGLSYEGTVCLMLLPDNTLMGNIMATAYKSHQDCIDGKSAISTFPVCSVSFGFSPVSLKFDYYTDFLPKAESAFKTKLAALLNISEKDITIN